MKNKYEDPTQRLVSQTWSDEYKKNYEKVFGKKESWLDRKERAEAAKEERDKDDGQKVVDTGS